MQLIFDSSSFYFRFLFAFVCGDEEIVLSYGIISLPRKKEQESIIILNGSRIERVRSHKFLGIEIDDNLDFEDHCNALTKKVSKRIGLLKHISLYLKRKEKEIHILQCCNQAYSPLRCKHLGINI